MSDNHHDTTTPLSAREPAQAELANLPSPRHKNQQTKIERYSWKLADEPGEFKLINKRELVIDPSYQRKLSQPKLLRLAREWSWIACGAVSVSWREPLGRHLYYVMEGQHRVAAAQRRADIDVMPCMVFKSLKLEEEASGFLNANSNRGALTMQNRHDAALITGTHSAVVTDELTKSIGRIVAPYTGPATLNCVSAMIEAIDTDEVALRRIFMLIGMLCDGKPLPRTLVAGLFYVETHLPEGRSLVETKLTQRLLDRGFNRIMESIASAMRLRGRGRASTCAEGIMAVLNFKARNPIQLVTGKEEDA